MGEWIWHNSGRIVGIALLIALTAFSLNWLYVRLRPDINYLQYTQLTVDDTVVGQQAVATICRNTEGNYDAEGSVAFYIVDKEGNKVFNSEEDFPMTIVKSNSCIREHIPTQKLKPGRYELILYRQFKVGTWSGIQVPKKVDYRSNMFNVTDEIRSLEDITKKILELEQQIQDLRNRAGELIPGFTTDNPAPVTIINNYIQEQAQPSKINGKATAPGQLKKGN